MLSLKSTPKLQLSSSSLLFRSFAKLSCTEQLIPEFRRICNISFKKGFYLRHFIIWDAANNSEQIFCHPFSTQITSEATVTFSMHGFCNSISPRTFRLEGNILASFFPRHRDKLCFNLLKPVKYLYSKNHASKRQSTTRNLYSYVPSFD